jgi:alkyl hydroperoxide reductase subunit AhpC
MALQLGDIAPDFEIDSTEGPIQFHKWLGDSWGVLFSHPKNFTPICTTELGYAAKLKPEFDKRGVKIIGLSVDELANHGAWAADIKETQGFAVNFPVIADANRRQEDQVEPDLPGQHGAQLRRDFARHRFVAIDREASSRNAGELETWRGRRHRPIRFRRRCEGEIPGWLEDLEALFAGCRATASLSFISNHLLKASLLLGKEAFIVTAQARFISYLCR